MTKISIITSTLNCASDLLTTINSIRLQSYKNIQWIVVDGNSTDGTIELIKENLDIITDWITESDCGIYDAWNKGLKLARGEWIQFLGAGDEFASYDVLEKMSSQLQEKLPDHRLVYGQVQYISPTNRLPLAIVGEDWEQLKKQWDGLKPALPPHPGIFHHHSLFHNQQFSLKFPIAGDTEFLLRCLKITIPSFIPILIDKMPLGGLSGSIDSSLRFNREILRICHSCGVRIPIHRRIRSLIIDTFKRLSIATFGKPATAQIVDLLGRLFNKPSIWSQPC